MSEITVYISISLAVGFCAILLWFVRPRRNSPETGNLPNDPSLESIHPHHYRFFPQIRQALSAGDQEFLRQAAPPHVARQAMRERRAIARQFLAGLYEDFSKLERLARMVAALSPVISREQETDRLVLSLKFRVLYGLVWLRLSTDRVPLQQIDHLTGLIGRLALRMEQAMAEINALSAERLARGLNV